MSIEKPEAKVVICPRCRCYYRIERKVLLKPGTNLRCTKCGHVFEIEHTPSPAVNADGPRVLIASDGDEVRGIVSETLREGGFALCSVSEGDEAWRLILEWKPRATILDVGLPGMPVFEICSRVRQNTEHKDLGIILLASVYEKTRYKRMPTSLYGADDYIEKHHLRDSLVSKIERLLPRGKAAGRFPPDRREEEVREGKKFPSQSEVRKEEKTLKHEERFGSRESPDTIDTSQHEDLKRFARIIVSDIALYNQELVERGAREGSMTQLLEKEFEEGRRLYETRLSSGAGSEQRFYQQAIEEFIEQQRDRFSGSGQDVGTV